MIRFVHQTIQFQTFRVDLKLRSNINGNTFKTFLSLNSFYTHEEMPRYTHTHLVNIHILEYGTFEYPQQLLIYLI